MRWIVVAIGLLSGLSGSAQNWESLGNGLSSAVRCFYNDTVDSLLYVGGNFKYADGISVSGIATWDGVQWDSVGLGQNDTVNLTTVIPVQAITRYNGEIYAGMLRNAGDIEVNGIARWDGVKWDSVGTGVETWSGNEGLVLGLIAWNNELWVTGNFQIINGDTIKSVARWDGSQWYDAGFPTSGFIGSPVIYQGDLYVAGNFNGPNGMAEIAMWDGNSWTDVGGGINGGGDEWVNTMAVYNGELYVGGNFTYGDGNAGNMIMRWDGTQWKDVGGGITAQVFGLGVFDGYLYAAGQFSVAGGIPAKKIARWDGTEWCGLGSQFDNNGGQIGVYNDSLYLGGGFWTIDGDTMNMISKWIGGSYVDTCGWKVGEDELIAEEAGVKVYPNPTSHQFTVSGITKYPAEISLFDLTGRVVINKVIRREGEAIDVSHLPKGLYLWQIKTPHTTVRGKLLRQ